MRLQYTVLLFPGGRGWLTAVVPALPGCVSQGRTPEEALAHVEEAMEGWLAVWREQGGRELPKDTIATIVEAVREALEIQHEIREEDGEDIEIALELRTVSGRQPAVA